MIKHKTASPILLCILLVLGACSKHDQPHDLSGNSQMTNDSLDNASLQKLTDLEYERPVDGEQDPLSTAFVHEVSSNQKPLVMVGDFHFEVENVRQTLNYIQALTKSHQGYIASESMQNEQGRSERFLIGDGQVREVIEYSPSATLVVRIPKQELPAFLQNLQTRITFFLTGQLSAKDASLEIKKAQLEAQIHQLQSQALDNMASNVQTTQSLTLSRLNAMYANLSEQALMDEIAFATLQLAFFEPTKVHIRTVQDFESKLAEQKQGNFGKRLKDNLSVGWSYLLELVLWGVRFWAVLTFGLLLWFGLPKGMQFIKNHRNKLLKPPVLVAKDLTKSK